MRFVRGPYQRLVWDIKFSVGFSNIIYLYIVILNGKTKGTYLGEVWKSLVVVYGIDMQNNKSYISICCENHLKCAEFLRLKMERFSKRMIYPMIC